MIAIAGVVAIGWLPQLVIFGVLHLFVIVALMGEKMAARYDLQAAWRERYKMDDFGVARLQKTITRSAASLPSLIIWALAPKEEGMALAVGGIAALALAALGMRGLVRMRSWGVLALARRGRRRWRRSGDFTSVRVRARRRDCACRVILVRAVSRRQPSRWSAWPRRCCRSRARWSGICDGRPNGRPLSLTNPLSTPPLRGARDEEARRFRAWPRRGPRRPWRS